MNHDNNLDSLNEDENKEKDELKGKGPDCQKDYEDSKLGEQLNSKSFSEEQGGIPDQYGKDSMSDHSERNKNKISNGKLLFKNGKQPNEVLNNNP